MSDTVEKVKLEMLETLLKGINEKLQKAEVLNGGFDRMQSDISLLRENTSEIRAEVFKLNADLSHVKEQSGEFKKDLARIDEAIYHPDEGIYTRIRRTSDMEELRDKKIDKAIEKIDNVECMVAPIQKTDQTLKSIAGEDLKDLESVVKTRKNIDRVFWILITAILGGIGKFVWDAIAANI